MYLWLPSLTLLLSFLLTSTSSFNVDELVRSISQQPGSFTPQSSSHFYDTYRSGLLSSHPVPRSNTTTLLPSQSISSDSIPSSYSVLSKYGSSCSSPSFIYDQGSCGGCWALSVAAVLSDRFCQKGKDVVLSPQDLLDCTEGDSKGCNGGFTEDGFGKGSERRTGGF